jgi:hypothetical protein
MNNTSKIVLIMTCLGPLAAFGFCIVSHVLATFQSLFNALEAIK